MVPCSVSVSNSVSVRYMMLIQNVSLFSSIPSTPFLLLMPISLVLCKVYNSNPLCIWLYFGSCWQNIQSNTVKRQKPPYASHMKKQITLTFNDFVFFFFRVFVQTETQIRVSTHHNITGVWCIASHTVISTTFFFITFILFFSVFGWFNREWNWMCNRSLLWDFKRYSHCTDDIEWIWIWIWISISIE